MGTILMPGGGGGIDLDVVTAAAGDILSGKVIVGADGEPLTGTLALTGNAGTGDVLSGKTFYNDDAKTKRSGTMENRGELNWSEINTTKSVDAGYYSDGTLDSRPSYTAGQNAVKNSPNSYGLYTKEQYDANYNNGRNQGRIDAGAYAFHHILRLYSNPSPNTYLMNPSTTADGSTKWTNPAYYYNGNIFSYSNGVYTAKVACKLGVDGEIHTRYGGSLQYIQYSVNNGGKNNIVFVNGSNDDYAGYEGHGYVTVSLAAGQNIRFFFGDAEANNTDTDFIIMARVV